MTLMRGVAPWRSSAQHRAQKHAALLLFSSLAQASVEWTTMTDANLDVTLASHRVVVIAGCASDSGCDALGTELARAAKILGRVAQDGTSMALGSVALHRSGETAGIAERYRFGAAPLADGGSAEARCETVVIVDGLQTDFGFTDDGSAPLISNLARGLVAAIMREIVPGAKALQENAGLVTELTVQNFDTVLARTKTDRQLLLINFYQPPVSLRLELIIVPRRPMASGQMQ
jgi:hypothetical protein